MKVKIGMYSHYVGLGISYSKFSKFGTRMFTIDIFKIFISFKFE